MSEFKIHPNDRTKRLAQYIDEGNSFQNAMTMVMPQVSKKNRRTIPPSLRKWGERMHQAHEYDPTTFESRIGVNKYRDRVNAEGQVIKNRAEEERKRAEEVSQSTSEYSNDDANSTSLWERDYNWPT